MPRPGRPKVTWKTVQSDPEYRALWDLLQSGPKTFKQLRTALGAYARDPASGTPLVRPGTLLKRLRKMDRAGLVRFESRPEVLKRFVEGKLLEPDQEGVGRPAKGVWMADPGDSASIQVALAHAAALSASPKENLTLERVGNGTEVLVAGTRGDNARWWYPGNFDGGQGRLFEVLDAVARELGRTLLASDPEAVRAQRRAQEVVARFRRVAELEKKPVATLPPVRAALEEAGRHSILLSVRVVPSYWWDTESGPVDLTSKAEVTLARIHDQTRPPSMPLRVAEQARAANLPWTTRTDKKGVSILVAKVGPMPAPATAGKIRRRRGRTRLS